MEKLYALAKGYTNRFPNGNQSSKQHLADEIKQ